MGHRKNAFAASSQRWIENTCMVHDVESRWLLPYSALLSYWTRIIRYRFDLSVMILEEGSYVVLVRVWGRRKGRIERTVLSGRWTHERTVLGSRFFSSISAAE